MTNDSQAMAALVLKAIVRAWPKATGIQLADNAGGKDLVTPFETEAIVELEHGGERPYISLACNQLYNNQLECERSVALIIRGELVEGSALNYMMGEMKKPSIEQKLRLTSDVEAATQWFLEQLEPALVRLPKVQRGDISTTIALG
jgi:hypothetical protein